MKSVKKIRVITGPLEFVRAYHGPSITGQMQYSITMLLPPSAKETIEKINAAVAEIKADWKMGSWAQGVLRQCGDRVYFEYPTDWFFLRANAAVLPGCVDLELNQIEFDDFTPGCIARASISFSPYNSNGSVGVGAGLDNIQLLVPGRDRMESAIQDFG
jgi:hypothetical protein